jgi:VWFA-related protein
MFRSLITAIACVLLITVAPVAKQAAAPSALVELDVSVTDKNGVVTDLKQADFQVQDDGKRVELKSFSTVLARGSAAQGDGREIVLVLDDAGVPMAGTQALQQIASMFVQAARPGDSISVVRLHKADDEVSKDRQAALARIAAFQAGSIPFFQNETTEDTLRLVTKLSNHWAETMPHRRKAIVCIGSPAVCSPDEREETAPRDMYSTWVNVLTATARANTVFYGAVPARFTLAGGGLAERTGGDVLGGTSNFVDAVERVYADLSHYYLLGYEPPASKKDLRNISVRVNRRGITVHTRNKRGK